MSTLDTILKYMFFCHRLPERSFFIKGKQLPLCARCTGILVGYLIGILLLVFNIDISLLGIILLLLPLVIDGYGQYLGYFTSTNSRRFITGILAGISTIYIFKSVILLGLESGKSFTRYILN